MHSIVQYKKLQIIIHTLRSTHCHTVTLLHTHTPRSIIKLLLLTKFKIAGKLQKPCPDAFRPEASNNYASTSPYTPIHFILG